MLIDLAVTPIAETIRNLSAQRKSGDLQIRTGKIVKTVFFDHGRIVFAASNMKKDRLGEALVAVGQITEDDYQRATALMRGERRRRFGEALVHAGVLDRKEVGRSVARQVKRIVVSFFEFAEGAASFEERRCPIPLEYMVSVSIHRIIYVGIKAMKSRELILTGLGNLDRWVVLAAVPPFPFGIRKCSAEELDVLEQAKRRVTLRRLAWGEGGLTLTRLRTVYSLLASGLLEPADKPEGKPPAPEPIVHMETSTFLLSALQGRPDPSSQAAIRQEVNEELQRSARLDRETWLKVSRSAPKEELIRALEEKMERYHALLDAVGEDAELKTDIELILGRASTMLRLAKQPEPPREAKAAPAAPSEAAREAPPPAPAPQEAARAAAATVAPAMVAPAMATPPAAAEAAPSPAAAFADDAAPPPLPRRIGREGGLTDPKARLEHLLMEAQVRMTVSDYANAVNVYREVVELAPNVPAYHFRLAIAMTCYPRTAKLAEREFLEAVRLQPDDADLHYNFALYYKAMKVRSRAVAELRTAVRLDPRHMLARQELEALSPKDSALTSLKNLFKGR
jgi:tetratricopeptide (TPR) repeat protein